MGEGGGGRAEGRGEEVQRAGLLSRWTGGAALSQSVLTGWNQMEARGGWGGGGGWVWESGGGGGG